jgi:FKBP-type peptidyl-prolyl cis-trans isomerase
MFFLLMSCQRPSSQEEQPADRAWIKERLIGANRQFVRNQLDDIDSYIERHGYLMDTTATGLHYQIKRLTKPSLRQATLNDIAGIRYTIELLDGRKCYTADRALYREYRLASDDMPAGLREGILMMKEGERALFIIPSYLAFGITGDGDCIPPNAALVMTVTLVRVISPPY